MPIRIAPLAAALLAALIGPALAQGTDEQQAACAGDAFTLCRDVIPDVPKITACMKAHEAQLSPKCHAVFVAASSPTPKKSDTAMKSQPDTVVRSKTKAATKPARPVAHQVAKAKPEPPHVRRLAAEVMPASRPLPPTAPVASPVAQPPASSVPGLDSYRASIVDICRKGLIDPYTCRSTLQLLETIE